ncbi:MAG TPA: peptide ABC transporter substrate-binding protein [Gemmatimonadaceae bacterium]
MISRSLIALAIVAMMACADKSATRNNAGGTVVIAATGSYGSLFPPNVSSTAGRQITELVYDYLTEVGLSLNTTDDRTFAPRLAKSWQWSADSMSLAVQIDPAARWHDGKPVRSEDVRYSFSIYSDTSFSSLASELASIDSVTARDSLTAVFWFSKRYPLQFYDATSQMQILPRHIYGRYPTDSLTDAVASIDPVGSGRYRFVLANGTESVELAADTANYRGRPNISRLIWRVFGDPDQAARALFAGEVDIYDALRPSHLSDTTDHSDVRVIMSPGSDYAFMAFNTKRPPLNSREVRRAISMTVERDAMVKNVFDSLAISGIGPTVSYFLSGKSSLEQIPYDPARAGAILDSLGWHADPKTGIRKRNGRELRFKAILPSTSSARVRMATLMQEQLRKAGIAMDPDAMEFGTFNSRFFARDFDAALASWHLGTSPAQIRLLWTSSAPQNFGSYSSAVFDAYVDSAVNAPSEHRANAYYAKAYQVAIDDAAAIWLYEPRLVLGINKRITTRPYRPDAWWWSLSDWKAR